jgi:hypothetical protein
MMSNMNNLAVTPTPCRVVLARESHAGAAGDPTGGMSRAAGFGPKALVKDARVPDDKAKAQ